VISCGACAPRPEPPNGKAGRSCAGGLGARFLRRPRMGSEEDSSDGLLVEVWLTSRRSSTGSRPTATSRSVAASRASEAAAAARKRSKNDSGNTGRSTWAGGRAPFVPRTRRGSADDDSAGPPCAGGAVTTSGMEDSPCAGGTASAVSAGRSVASGECSDGGTRLPSPMRKPPCRRERGALNCRTAEHTSSYISRRIAKCHDMTTQRIRCATSCGQPRP
jgi:hypothetical protein